MIAKMLKLQFTRTITSYQLDLDEALGERGATCAGSALQMMLGFDVILKAASSP